ncbi:hypothetical protein CKM354_000935100 [Cercospora kikuchii]|uniref:Uncharacterized protein n=1 Tax=Cercospora kikuchii TaxID=84275 RepID=A0A9P3FG95_9PEZI|nr:uncharacterized protein CKM354_000935100 [Cercospora kikuchii]GIZ46216.1 hypothetical protein CKM354_000935100 [Cercospora kikuchii]
MAETSEYPLVFTKKQLTDILKSSPLNGLQIARWCYDGAGLEDVLPFECRKIYRLVGDEALEDYASVTALSRGTSCANSMAQKKYKTIAKSLAQDEEARESAKAAAAAKKMEDDISASKASAGKETSVEGTATGAPQSQEPAVGRPPAPETTGKVPATTAPVGQEAGANIYTPRATGTQETPAEASTTAAPAAGKSDEKVSSPKAGAPAALDKNNPRKGAAPKPTMAQKAAQGVKASGTQKWVKEYQPKMFERKNPATGDHYFPPVDGNKLQGLTAYALKPHLKWPTSRETDLFGQPRFEDHLREYIATDKKGRPFLNEKHLFMSYHPRIEKNFHQCKRYFEDHGIWIKCDRCWNDNKPCSHSWPCTNCVAANEPCTFLWATPGNTPDPACVHGRRCHSIHTPAMRFLAFRKALFGDKFKQDIVASCGQVKPCHVLSEDTSTHAAATRPVPTSGSRGTAQRIEPIQLPERPVERAVFE